MSHLSVETVLHVIKTWKDECRILGIASGKYEEKQIRLYFYRDNRKDDIGIELFNAFKGYMLISTLYILEILI